MLMFFAYTNVDLVIQHFKTCCPIDATNTVKGFNFAVLKFHGLPDWDLSRWF